MTRKQSWTIVLVTQTLVMLAGISVGLAIGNLTWAPRYRALRQGMLESMMQDRRLLLDLQDEVWGAGPARRGGHLDEAQGLIFRLLDYTAEDINHLGGAGDGQLPRHDPAEKEKVK